MHIPLATQLHTYIRNTNNLIKLLSGKDCCILLDARNRVTVLLYTNSLVDRCEMTVLTQLQVIIIKCYIMYTHLQLLPCYSKQVGMISTSNIHCRHHRTVNSILLLFFTYLFTYFIHHFCNSLWSCKAYHSFIHAAILQYVIQLYHNYCDVHKFIIVVMTTLELLGVYQSYIHPCK